jgi:hypothetical protein
MGGMALEASALPRLISKNLDLEWLLPSLQPHQMSRGGRHHHDAARFRTGVSYFGMVTPSK